MSDPNLVVRVAANLTEWRSNFAEVTGTLETTKGALASMSSAFDGSRAISQANAVQDATADGSLGADAPTTDTSGL